ncbi:MAG: pilus assembly protein PilZ [Sulfuriferula sp.]|nr:pilus assembly protein PilZ [Sulfuriferula sp.]
MSAVPPVQRPGVLSLSIKEKTALFAAYMPFVKGGGLFVPSTKAYQLGDEVFMLLSLLDDVNKIPVAGKVVWVTPVGCHGGKTPGIGVQFDNNENGIFARNKIESGLGSALKAVRPTHTL